MAKVQDITVQIKADTRQFHRAMRGIGISLFVARHSDAIIAFISVVIFALGVLAGVLAS